LSTYQVVDATVEISDYPENAVGPVVIPAEIAGKPVTSIEDGAFLDCTGLTSVTIPSSVTIIGDSSFRGCRGLTSVTIPSSVIRLGESWDGGPSGGAFVGCSGLTTAAFLGNAPDFGEDGFIGAAPGFRIYYLSGRTGFTSPTWHGYPATMIDEATYPAASWLLAHGLWYDTDLHADPDGDGVGLLMAYALNLDPRLNLQSSLPAPVLSADTLSLSFHATSPGITYKVETSTDLQHWTSQGVTQSAPGQDRRSTASVPRDSASRFLRLVVED
jgi:hypothetical protein